MQLRYCRRSPLERRSLRRDPSRSRRSPRQRSESWRDYPDGGHRLSHRCTSSAASVRKRIRHFTMFAFGDVGISLYSRTTRRSRAAASTSGSGTALNTGSSGTGTPDKTSHYEEDFYVMFNLGVGKGITHHAVLHRLHEPERLVRHGEGIRVQGRARQQVRAVRDRRVRD